jgi:hypothetical protein
MISRIENLHTHNFIHRDIKVSLTSFGSTKVILFLSMISHQTYQSTDLLYTDGLINHLLNMLTQRNIKTSSGKKHFLESDHSFNADEVKWFFKSGTRVNQKVFRKVI